MARTQHVRKAALVVQGLPEVQRAFRQTSKDLGRDLRKEFQAVATAIIRKAEGRGAPRRALKPSVTGKAVGVSFPAGGPGSGDSRLGFYPWMDFGGGAGWGRGVRARERATVSRGRRRSSVGVGGTRRDVIREGRYLYPAIGESRDEIRDGVFDAVEAAARRNQLRVEG